MSQNEASITLDIRVRDRLIKRGQLDPKDLEKHTANLPDLTERAHTIEVPQPALAGRSAELASSGGASPSSRSPYSLGLLVPAHTYETGGWP